MKSADPIDAARLTLALNDLRLPAIKNIWPDFAARAGFDQPISRQRVFGTVSTSQATTAPRSEETMAVMISSPRARTDGDVQEQRQLTTTR